MKTVWMIDKIQKLLLPHTDGRLIVLIAVFVTGCVNFFCFVFLRGRPILFLHVRVPGGISVIPVNSININRQVRNSSNFLIFNPLVWPHQKMILTWNFECHWKPPHWRQHRQPMLKNCTMTKTLKSNYELNYYIHFWITSDQCYVTNTLCLDGLCPSAQFLSRLQVCLKVET